MTREEHDMRVLVRESDVIDRTDGSELAKAFNYLWEKYVEQEPCEDAISRQAVLDAVRKNTFRLTFAEEQGCEGHVAWSAEAVYSDVIEGALLELPPVNSQPKTGYSKTGYWIRRNSFLVPYKCSECNYESERYYDFCPNCGAKMFEPQKSEE